MGTLVAGSPAPDFSLPLAGGGTASLASYRGRKLVIFFYPKADTPGCTREAIEFSAAKADFSAAGTDLLGVSHDPVKKQEKFVAKHELTAPIASDETLDMLQAYGVWGGKSLYGRFFMGIERTTVLIDKDGIVSRVWSKVRVPGHVAEVLAAAKAS
ncbi:peroxiredoxin [Labrys monachus]|uniref:thioredoxin-dependent peroxiredoxin n=1 Tax=Labrys monachus TaxID=217067 RepID=A0ABU0FLX2_9HYPH|nr:peroxiredoxin [Labrys monachus]MDQ0395055.1 peroxiredoxin Q/BCP [Labrys monachus]